jgi:hypothetical protein
MRALLFLVLMADVALGRSVISGRCEPGNQRIYRPGHPASDTVQASYPGCSISVCLAGTSTFALIYNAAGTVLSNPLTANSDGTWELWTDGSSSSGAYAAGVDVTLSGAGMPNAFTRTYYGLRGTMSVKDIPFNARGDGMTDDTAAINSALRAACSGAGGGAVGATITLPAGVYKISLPITIECSGVILSGSGGAIIKGTSANADVIFVTTSGTVDTMNFAVRDLAIQGPNPAGSTGYSGDCIHIQSHTRGEIRKADLTNLDLTGCGRDGVRFDGPVYPTPGGTQSWRIDVKNVTVNYAGEDCFNATGWIEQLTFEDPYCEQAGRDAFRLAYGRMNPNAGLGQINRIAITRPSVSAVGHNHKGWVFYLQGTVGTHVYDPYWDGITGPASTGGGFAYLEDTFDAMFSGETQRTTYGSPAPYRQYGFEFATATSRGNYGTYIDLPNFRAGEKAAYKSLICTSGVVKSAVLRYHGTGGNGSVPVPFAATDWDPAGAGTVADVRYEAPVRASNAYRVDSYDVRVIGNGTNGCVSPTNCWQINGTLGPPLATAARQDGIYFAQPDGAGLYVNMVRMQLITSCAGSATAMAGFGDSTNPTYYFDPSNGFDLAAGPANVWPKAGQTLANLGASIATPERIGPIIATTGGNVSNLHIGCEFKVWVGYFNAQ